MRSGRPIDKENDTPKNARHREMYALRMAAKRATNPPKPRPKVMAKDYEVRLAIAVQNLLKLNPPLGWEKTRKA